MVIKNINVSIETYQFFCPPCKQEDGVLGYIPIPMAWICSAYVSTAYIHMENVSRACVWHTCVWHTLCICIKSKENYNK
jgi:hypothetical protein